MLAPMGEKTYIYIDKSSVETSRHISNYFTHRCEGLKLKCLSQCRNLKFQNLYFNQFNVRMMVSAVWRNWKEKHPPLEENRLITILDTYLWLFFFSSSNHHYFWDTSKQFHRATERESEWDWFWEGQRLYTVHFHNHNATFKQSYSTHS